MNRALFLRLVQGWLMCGFGVDSPVDIDIPVSIHIEAVDLLYIILQLKTVEP